MHVSQTHVPVSQADGVKRDASMTLRDGRVLAYTDLGPPTSPVVMYCHGAPGSRLDLAIFEHAFLDLDVRVVSADRPGYGRSSPQPRRRREDWPEDVAALADHLGIERFAVMGASSGGPYAVACAALLPERVASVGVVCGETDFGWTGAWDGYPDSDEAVLMRIGDEAKALAWCEDRYGQDGSGFLQAGLTELAPPDLAALEDDALASALVMTVSEAFRQGVGGYAQDVVAQARAWSFDPRAIVAPALVLHGEVDTLTPLAHARHSAEVMPTARLSTRADQGHISVLTEIPQLAAKLLDTLR